MSFRHLGIVTLAAFVKPTMLALCSCRQRHKVSATDLAHCSWEYISGKEAHLWGLNGERSDDGMEKQGGKADRGD